VGRAPIYRWQLDGSVEAEQGGGNPGRGVLAFSPALQREYLFFVQEHRPTIAVPRVASTEFCS
jgi:hypothetical protein